MHLVLVLVDMQGNQRNQLSDEYAGAIEIPSRGLFSRIIKRLGLEKELALVKRHLRSFVVLLVIFLGLVIFASIGIKHELAESSVGPFLSLIFSDPGIVIKYWHSFVFAAFESMPGVMVTVLFLSLAFLVLFIRLAVFTVEKLFIVIKSINKQKYGNR